MLIVSQDKTAITNFKNLISIWVEDVNDIDGKR